MNLWTSGIISSSGAPLESVPSEWESLVPEHAELLRKANGLCLHGGAVRVFGIGERSRCRDAIQWNAASWRDLYQVPQQVRFWGENVFGDQFGIDILSGRLVLLYCEGGATEELKEATILETIQQPWAESALADSAGRLGLLPTEEEHLSFIVPLMCGGTSDAGNLEVLAAEAHLTILGQLVDQSRLASEGTAIRAFRQRQ